MSQPPTWQQPTAPLPSAPQPKPFLKRPWVWGVAAALVVGIGIGNAGAGAGEAEPAEAAAATSSSSTAAESTSAAPAPTTTVPPAAVVPPTTPPPAPTTPAEVVVDFAMPDLVGVDLQTAQNTVQTNGVFLSRSHDLLGSRNQVLDSNWVVCTQNIAPGQRVTGEAEGLIDFGVVKREETCP
ncbi:MULTISPECIES: hypothetical protein [unclassified Geodermatophilus]|uniref:hypothetical protein n=1 Tax=unclassified Geodermatophilus TaxID=2637632 RepID=UPI003EEC77A8